MIIGFYGYIGTGKTMACKYLKNKYNFNYLNADEIAKKIMQDSKILMFLKETFPETFINNIFNSNIFRKIIFNNLIINKKINNYLWPKVNNKIISIINNNYNNNNFLIEAICLDTLKLFFKKKYLLYLIKKILLIELVIEIIYHLNK